jgi:hypothetical protein
MMPSSNRPRRTFSLALAAAVLFSVIAVSCWHPVFDWMLSESEITVRKLGEPTLYFTSDVYDGYDTSDYWFLPPMSNSPWTGVLVIEKTDRLRFKSIPSIDTVNHRAIIDQMANYETPNSLGDAYLVHADPNGNSNFIVVAARASGESRMMTLTTNGAITPPTTDGPFGIGVVAQNLATQATVACFAHPLPSTSQFKTVTWITGAPNLAGPSVLIFTAGDQATVPGRFLATTTYFYLSCGMSDGSEAIFRWVAATANTIDAIRYSVEYGPLIGALSDGRLLAQKDGIISVLDPDLNFLFKFPAGRLRFVHERYDNLIDFEMKVVFTRTIFARNSPHDSDGTLLVEVYEIPTANLEDLAD